MKIFPVEQAVLFYWSWVFLEMERMNRKVSTLHSFSCRWVYVWACQSPVGGIVLHEIFRLLLTDTFYMRYLIPELHTIEFVCMLQ